MSIRLEIPGITLHYFAEKWNNELKGGYIQHLRAGRENVFLLRVNTKQYMKELVVTFPNVIAESMLSWKPMEEQPPIVNATKKIIENERITRVFQYGLDRVLVIEGEKHSIILELFGAGNMIVIDDHGIILSVWNAKAWKGRTLKMREKYAFPNGPRAWNELPEKVEEADFPISFRDWGTWLVSQMGVPQSWIEIICANVKRKPTEKKKPTQAEWKKVREQLKQWFDRKAEAFVEAKHKEKILILPSHGEEGNPKSWAETMERIEREITKEAAEPETNSKIEMEKKSLQINLERQQHQVKEWRKKIEALQKCGEWIYSHFESVENVLRAVSRGRKQKISSKKMGEELRKRVPGIKEVNLENNTLEWEVD